MQALDELLDDYIAALSMGRYEDSQEDVDFLERMSHEQKMIIMDAMGYSYDEGFAEGLRISKNQ